MPPTPSIRFIHRIAAATCQLPLLLLAVTPALARASSFQWIAPAPAELAMTSEPKAPGASAIVLSYSETDDADSAEVLVHVRIKVLTEAGRDAGNVETPARIVSNDEFNRDFFARTIHPDGSTSHTCPTRPTATSPLSTRSRPPAPPRCPM